MNSTKWIKQIEEITHAFINEFGNLSVEELNWKPAQNIWSIAQNIEHLIVINETYYPTIDSVRNGTYKLPAIGKIGFIVNAMGRAVLKSVHPDRRIKMKTFTIWEPSSSDISKDIILRFEKHQKELQELIKQSEDVIGNGVVIASPAKKNIVYKLTIAFDIIVSHEQRHLEQARELLAKQS